MTNTAPSAPYPICFECEDGWRQWRELAWRTERVSPCDDCTLIYRQRMARLGRCEEAQVRERFTIKGAWNRRLEL